MTVVHTPPQALKYKVYVNGRTYQWERRDFASTVKEVAKHHRNGDRWDVQVANRNDRGTRRLDAVERAALMEAVTEEIIGS